MSDTEPNEAIEQLGWRKAVKDSVLNDAEQEYDQIGTLSTDTFIAMTNLGFDAQDWMDQREKTYGKDEELPLE